MSLITPIPEAPPVGDGISYEEYFHDLLREADLRKTELGRILGVHGDTVSRWKDDPPQYAVAYLELYVGLKRLL